MTLLQAGGIALQLFALIVLAQVWRVMRLAHRKFLFEVEALEEKRAAESAAARLNDDAESQERPRA